jgi:uncharacterized protein (TIGR03118 family)
VGNISPTDFTVTENRKSAPAQFIFATQDGTISAWNQTVDGGILDPSTGTTLSHATIVVDQAVAGATYTGLAIGINKEGQTFLLCRGRGSNRAVDMFDGTFAFVKSFSDPKIPKKFHDLRHSSDQRRDLGDVYSPEQGAERVCGRFATDGTLLRHDAIHGPLHSPWGIAQARADFGPMSNAILISNNISRGRVNAWIRTRAGSLGLFVTPMATPSKSITFGRCRFGQDGGPNGAHNQLFFTGGPNGYANGIFGVIPFGQ